MISHLMKIDGFFPDVLSQMRVFETWFPELVML